MKKILEKTAVLCLSLILISTYSVSAALPQMKKFFSGVPASSVENMVSVTSLAVMCTVIGDIWLHRKISEKTSIVTGLILAAVSGTVPVWCRSFSLIFISRIALGIGVGLVNTCAITIIQDRYQGKEQAFLLGVRGAMETLGGAALTLVAGACLKDGWNKAFLIYLAALPILILFLLFGRGDGEKSSGPERAASKQVSSQKHEKRFQGAASKRAASQQAASERAASKNSAKGEAFFMVSNMLLGGLFIFVNTSNTMRLPDVVIDRGIGTDQDASVVLSVLQAVGVIGGIFYGKIRSMMKKNMFPVTILIYGLGSAFFAFGRNLPMLYLGAVFAGYGNGLLTTILFNRLSDVLPPEKVGIGTHIILVGCNLGATSTPLIMKGLEKIRSGNTFLFSVYAAAMALLAAAEFAGKFRNRKEG